MPQNHKIWLGFGVILFLGFCCAGCGQQPPPPAEPAFEPIAEKKPAPTVKINLGSAETVRKTSIAKSEQSSENAIRSFSGAIRDDSDSPSEGGSEWGLTADPLPSMPELVERAVKVNLDSMVNAKREVFFSEYYPRYVAIGSNRSRNDVRDFYDLWTRKTYGRFTGDLDIGDVFCLGYDGKLCAYDLLGTDRTIQVVDVATGSPLWKDDPGGDTKVLLIAGQRLVAVVTERFTPKIVVYSLESGEQLNQFQVKTRTPNVSANNFAVSPGGAWVAAFTGTNLEIYSTVENTPRVTVPLDMETSDRFRALAFSLDGQELACLYSNKKELRLISWDVVSGTKAANHTYEGEAKDAMDDPFGSRTDLQWLPDRKGWFVSNVAIIEHDSGKPVYTFSDEGSTFANPRRIALSTTHIVATGKTEAFKAAMISLAIPKAKMVKAFETIQEGGSAVDVNLPNLTPADWQSVKRRTLESASVWKVEPDAAPASEHETNEGQEAFSLSCKQKEIASVLLSPAPSDHAMVQVRIGGADNNDLASAMRQYRFASRLRGRQGGLLKQQIASSKDLGSLRYDLVRLGARSRVWEYTQVPPDFVPLGLSSDASQLVVTGRDDHNRVDLLDLSKKAGHFVGLRPIEQGDNAEVVFAELLANDAMMTYDSKGKLTLWQLPQCKAHYQIDTGNGGIAIRTPGGRYIVVGVDRQIDFLDLKSGESHGSLSVPASLTVYDDRTLSPAIAFRKDGAEMAIAVSGSTNTRWVYRFDLLTGEKMGDFEIPDDWGQTLQYVDSDYILVDRHALVELSTQEVVWKFTAENTRMIFAENSSDKYIWYVPYDVSTADRQAELRRVEPLHPDIPAFLKLTREGKILLKRGDSVSLSVENKGDDERKQRAESALERFLVSAGMKVAESADLTVSVETSQKPTGESVTYSNSPQRTAPTIPRLPGMPEMKMPEMKIPGINTGNSTSSRPAPVQMSVSQVEMLATVTLSFRRKKVWERQVVNRTTFGPFQRVKEGESLEKTLHAEQFEDLLRLVSELSIPHMISETRLGLRQIPGWATYGPTGLQNVSNQLD